MPHIPRRYVSILSPEVQAPPQAEKPPLPTRQPEANSQRNLLSLDKISLRKWTVDPKKIWKNLVGEEPHVDPYSGGLVYTPRGTPASG